VCSASLASSCAAAWSLPALQSQLECDGFRLVIGLSSILTV
jgi:hypothetical protein